MKSIEQEQLLNDLAHSLVVLDGRVYLAQQVYSGCEAEQNHLIEMQNCVRQMMQRLQLIHQPARTGDGPVGSPP